jgi:RNA polymerase sigma-70 factor (ECF subfamily)
MVSEGIDPADDELVSLTKDGSLDAFNSLVERYQSPVYSLCLRLLGSPQAAEDAAQEAFLSAYRALPSFAGGNVRSWLLRIAANESKDELRRRKRKDPAGSLNEMFGNPDSPIEVPDPGDAVELVVERKELSDHIQQALLRVPFDQRQAVVLADLYGYHYDEVATMTGASVGTVKSRIHRGRERLRMVLASEPELFGNPRRLDR